MLTKSITVEVPPSNDGWIDMTVVKEQVSDMLMKFKGKKVKVTATEVR